MGLEFEQAVPAKPDQHIVRLPTRLWKLLLAGGVITSCLAQAAPSSASA